jgi:hypothetical protein
MALEASFPVVDTTSWAWEMVEPMGKPGKRWLRAPDRRSWLWKPVTVQREASTSFPKGEDWAEKIAAELARALGIPAADADLAVRGDEQGVIISNVVPRGEELVHGNQILAAAVAGYPLDLRQEVPGYRVEVIAASLHRGEVGPTPGAPADLDALGVFVLYLGLDALIGNTDRHHVNWGVIRIVDENRMVLCPSFDHATSLGFQLSEARRLQTLAADDGVERYAMSGRSRPFEGRPGLVDLLVEGIRLRPQAADVLSARLSDLDEEALAELIDRTPNSRMSQPCRRFVQEMVMINRRRILHVCH